MKTNMPPLNVDVIGVQDKPLTQAEERAISAFIRKLKASQNPDSAKHILKQAETPVAKNAQLLQAG
jgi:hypothetical protein